METASKNTISPRKNEAKNHVVLKTQFMKYPNISQASPKRAEDIKIKEHEALCHTTSSNLRSLHSAPSTGTPVISLVQSELDGGKAEDGNKIVKAASPLSSK